VRRGRHGDTDHKEHLQGKGDAREGKNLQKGIMFVRHLFWRKSKQGGSLGTTGTLRNGVKEKKVPLSLGGEKGVTRISHKPCGEAEKEGRGGG